MATDSGMTTWRISKLVSGGGDGGGSRVPPPKTSCDAGPQPCRSGVRCRRREGRAGDALLSTTAGAATDTATAGLHPRHVRKTQAAHARHSATQRTTYSTTPIQTTSAHTWQLSFIREAAEAKYALHPGLVFLRPALA